MTHEELREQARGHIQKQLGTPVKCLNCGIKWLRITEHSNPGGTVMTCDIQYNCPNCGSNYWELIDGS